MRLVRTDFPVRRRFLAVLIVSVLVVAGLPLTTPHASATTSCLDRFTATVLDQTTPTDGCPAVDPLRRALRDRADPFLLIDDGRAFVYATRTATHRLPVTYGVDSGEVVTVDALPHAAEWSNDFFIWAPSVVRIGDRYVLYYTTRHVETGRQCISRAAGASPAGPFLDTSVRPLVCQHDAGGSIDPSVVRDPQGNLHLLYKNDGNCCRLPVSLFSQPLRSDGMQLAGDASVLVSADRWWDGGLIEGPSMVQLPNGKYLLSYSANRFGSSDYATGFAICDTVSGPCEKFTGAWDPNEKNLVGIGGLELSQLPGTTDIALTYHGWPKRRVGVDRFRSTRIGRVVAAEDLVCTVLAVAPCDGSARNSDLVYPNLNGPRWREYED